jgi:DNA/RNA-binding domain of Phe-tRNA-synthetase-like protein
MMRYDVNIADGLTDIYPDIRLGCLRFQAQVRKSDPQFWKYLDEEVLPQVRKKISGAEWNAVPGVKGSRAAYRAFGRDPGRYRVSSEALLRRVRRGDELYHVNSVVDVNNLVSVRTGMSAGSYDLAEIHGAVTLRKAGKGEGYQGIGKDFLDLENMLILADSEGPFGSSTSDSRRAMVTEKTRDILVVLYCFEKEIQLEQTLADAKEAFERFAKAADTETWIVSCQV